MEQDLLPIGSVVQLADSPDPLMIAGYLPIEKEHPTYMWDYSGFRFPLGFDSAENIFCFNHDQISVVYAHGYKDIEEENFLRTLTAARAQIEEQLQKESGDQPETDEEET